MLTYTFHLSLLMHRRPSSSAQRRRSHNWLILSVRKSILLQLIIVVVDVQFIRIRFPRRMRRFISMMAEKKREFTQAFHHYARLWFSFLSRLHSSGSFTVSSTPYKRIYTICVPVIRKCIRMITPTISDNIITIIKLYSSNQRQETNIMAVRSFNVSYTRNSLFL